MTNKRDRRIVIITVIAIVVVGWFAYSTYMFHFHPQRLKEIKIFADFAKSVRTPGSAIYTAEAYVAAGRLYKLAGKTADAKAVLESGKRFIQTVPAAERMNFQIYLGMLNNMLTQVK